MMRTALMRNSGPYKVQSCADGTLLITPAWPQFPSHTLEDGGGPGIFSRMGLAADIEAWLNGSALPQSLAANDALEPGAPS